MLQADQLQRSLDNAGGGPGMVLKALRDCSQMSHSVGVAETRRERNDAQLASNQNRQR